MLSKRESSAADQEVIRLLEAEELVNEQGEDYIRRNVSSVFIRSWRGKGDGGQGAQHSSV